MPSVAATRCFSIVGQPTFHVKQRVSMAKKGKRGARQRKRAHGRRHVLPALLIAIVLIGGFFGWMALSASIVRVCPAEVYLPDLPAQFDGTTILYISDVNIRSAADAAACTRLMSKLEAMHPDVLMLGGDYSAGTVLDALNATENAGDLEHAREFIQSLGRFPAALGKFAVAGEAERGGDPVMGAFAAAGVEFMQDGYAAIERDGARLIVAGLRDASENRTPYDEIGKTFQSGDCVIVLAHNPLSYTRIRMTEAKNGGAWADLVLSGHTLGGQIKLFGRTLRQFDEEEARRIGGWYYGDDLPILVSQGLGCRGAKLRLGTRSEVWMITLRRPSWQGEIQDDVVSLP